MTRRALLGQVHAALSAWEHEGRPADELGDCDILELYAALTAICGVAVDALDTTQKEVPVEGS